MEEVWLPIYLFLHMRWLLLICPFYGKLMGKPTHFAYIEEYHRMEIRCEKKQPYYEKSISSNF